MSKDNRLKRKHELAFLFLAISVLAFIAVISLPIILITLDVVQFSLR